MSNIVHDKYHRQNHHSFITSAVTDMGLDPIASKELPFSGEFVMDNADHETWLLSSDRAAFEWVSGYGDADTIKLDANLSGALGKSITYSSGAFNNVIIDGGATEAPALSVVGKSVFTDDVVYNGDIKLDGNLTVPTINTVGISADSVLISGDNGFALNVTNGSSKFNDVTGTNFVATENVNVTGDLSVGEDFDVLGEANVGGDLNVNGNLSFTSGIANGGFLNVAGSAIFGNLKVNGRIEADKYYFNEVVGKAIFNDYSGFVLHSTSLPDDKKTLIPNKDTGATEYNPGIGNFTLSGIGLSSDSWADFSGNVRIDGDKFYDDANQTIFSKPVYFGDTTSALYLSARNLSADNSIFTNLTGDDVYFIDASALKLSAYNLDVASATADYTYVTDFSGENISADKTRITSLTADNIKLLNPFQQYVSAAGFVLDNNMASITKNADWNSGLIVSQNIVNKKCIYTELVSRTSNLSVSGGGNRSYGMRVPNISFCDDQYWKRPQALYGNPGFGGGNENNVICGKDANDWFLPYVNNADESKQPLCDIKKDEAAITWYNYATSRIYIVGNHSGSIHYGIWHINEWQLKQNHNNEFCFDFWMITDGNASLGGMIQFKYRKNANMATQIGVLKICDMYGPSGGKVTMSELRGGKSGTVRTRLKIRFCPDGYAIVEILGIFNGSKSGSSWFT